MVTNSKIRVGIVGASPNRGFASIAHIPALQELPDFEISAVCTTRQDSADAAARHYGVPLAFCDAEKLASRQDASPAIDDLYPAERAGKLMHERSTAAKAEVFPAAVEKADPSRCWIISPRQK